MLKFIIFPNRVANLPSEHKRDASSKDSIVQYSAWGTDSIIKYLPIKCCKVLPKVCLCTQITVKPLCSMYLPLSSVTWCYITFYFEYFSFIKSDVWVLGCILKGPKRWNVTGFWRTMCREPHDLYSQIAVGWSNQGRYCGWGVHLTQKESEM